MKQYSNIDTFFPLHINLFLYFQRRKNLKRDKFFFLPYVPVVLRPCRQFLMMFMFEFLTSDKMTKTNRNVQPFHIRGVYLINSRVGDLNFLLVPNVREFWTYSKQKEKLRTIPYSRIHRNNALRKDKGILSPCMCSMNDTILSCLARKWNPYWPSYGILPNTQPIAAISRSGLEKVPLYLWRLLIIILSKLL